MVVLDPISQAAACRSPLLQWGFWRLVLDEAQLVANTNSVAAATTSQLWRRHAWVVTGTPITSRIDELRVCFVWVWGWLGTELGHNLSFVQAGMGRKEAAWPTHGQHGWYMSCSALINNTLLLALFAKQWHGSAPGMAGCWLWCS